MSVFYDTSNISSIATFSHTCSGTNRFLVVGVGDYSNDVTAVSYNGISLTKIASVRLSSFQYASMWYLINPPTGANNVVVTGLSGSSHFIISSSYTGVKQTGNPDSTNSFVAPGSPTSISIPTTVVANQCWLVGVAVAGFGQVNVNSFSLRKQNKDGSFNGIAFGLADTAKTVLTGSQSIYFDQSGSNSTWAGIVLSLAPASLFTPSDTLYFSAD